MNGHVVEKPGFGLFTIMTGCKAAGFGQAGTDVIGTVCQHDRPAGPDGIDGCVHRGNERGRIAEAHVGEDAQKMMPAQAHGHRFGLH